MSKRVVILTSLVLAFLVCSGPLTADDREGPCKEERTVWLNALELLSQALQEHSVLKEEDTAPRIERELGQKGGRVSMARIVQEVLQERAKGLDDVRKRIEALAAEEKNAFERCRRCASTGRAGRNVLSRSDPEVASREKLMAQMKDQTLDEAYLQYKGSRLPLPYTSAEGPGYASQAWYGEREGTSRSRGPYPGPGYDPYGYGNPRQPYPGYPGWR